MDVVCELQVLLPEGAKLFHALQVPVIDVAVVY